MSCNHRRLRRLAVAAKTAPLLGFDYCSGCKCERFECTSQRSKAMGAILDGRISSDGRWCLRHAREASRWEGRSQRNYANAFGTWNVPSSWDSSLQLVARYSYALGRLIPEDITAFPRGLRRAAS